MEKLEKEFEPRPNLDIQLDSVEDDLLLSWKDNKIVREILEQFRLTRKNIDAMEGGTEKENEKWHLLNRYRNLLKEKQPK